MVFISIFYRNFISCTITTKKHNYWILLIFNIDVHQDIKCIDRDISTTCNYSFNNQIQCTKLLGVVYNMGVHSPCLSFTLFPCHFLYISSPPQCLWQGRFSLKEFHLSILIDYDSLSRNSSNNLENIIIYIKEL